MVKSLIVVQKCEQFLLISIKCWPQNFHHQKTLVKKRIITKILLLGNKYGKKKIFCQGESPYIIFSSSSTPLGRYLDGERIMYLPIRSCMSLYVCTNIYFFQC